MTDHEEKCRQVMELLDKLSDEELHDFLDPQMVNDISVYMKARAARKVLLAGWWRGLAVLAGILLAIDTIGAKVLKLIQGMFS